MKSLFVNLFALALLSETGDFSAVELPRAEGEEGVFSRFLQEVNGQLEAADFPAKEQGIVGYKVRADIWTGNNLAQNDRVVRQTETTTTTTTARPKRPRPANIFGLISVLLTETRDDASRAFNEIGTLFNGQFANATTTKKPETAVSTTTTTTSASSESDQDNEITTTTEAFRITREEFLGILRSNVRGIANLFGKEFRVAIRDSNQNVREFGRDLGNALRPYFNN